MSAPAKAFFFIFVILALGALAHDLYVWHESNGFPFNFAALGWIAKTYYPAELQLVIDTLGAETFNMILTPILKIPAFFLTAGIAAFIFAVDFARRTLHAMNPGRGKDRDQKVKWKRYQ